MIKSRSTKKDSGKAHISTGNITGRPPPKAAVFFCNKKPVLYKLYGIILLCVLWTTFSLILGKYILPFPWETLSDTVFLLKSAYSLQQILITLLRIGFGFSLAFLAGSITGILTGRFKALQLIFQPIILLLQGIPPLLWAIPLILIFGTGHIAPVIVIAIICFPLIVLNIQAGMQTLPIELEEMLQVFAPKFPALFRELILPHLKPFIFASIKLGIALCIKASVIAEYFNANNGIGFQIYTAYQSFKIRSLFSWAVILIILILLSSDLIIDKLLNLQIAVGNFLLSLKSLIPSCFILKQKNHTELKALSFPSNKGIYINELSFSYNNKNKILDKIELKVMPSEIVVIYGDSGTGKTTLIKLIASILKSKDNPVICSANLSIAFQDDRFLPWRTILKNTALPLIYSGVPKQTAFKQAEKLLTDVGLGSDTGKYPHELSGGMKKRAGLARCFSRTPDVLLLDEPFTGLHKRARSSLWNKLQFLLEKHPASVIITTHFPEEVEIANSFYRLSGKPARLYKDINFSKSHFS